MDIQPSKGNWVHFVIVDLPPERLVQHLHILDHGKMLGVVRVKDRFNTDLPHFVVLCLWQCRENVTSTNRASVPGSNFRLTWVFSVWISQAQIHLAWPTSSNILEQCIFSNGDLSLARTNRRWCDWTLSPGDKLIWRQGFMHILNQKLLGSQPNWEETCQGFPSTNVSTVPPSHVVPKCQFMWCLNEKSIVQTFIMGCKLLHEMPSPKRLTVLGTSWHPEESLSWKRKACIPICYIHLHPPQTCSQFLHAWMAYVMTHSTDQHGIPVMQIQYQKGIFKKSSIGNHQKSCSSPFTVNIRTVNICELYWHRIIIGSS